MLSLDVQWNLSLWTLMGQALVCMTENAPGLESRTFDDFLKHLGRFD